MIQEMAVTLVRETALVPARLQRRKVGRGDDVSQSGHFKKPGETALNAHAQKMMPSKVY